MLLITGHARREWMLAILAEVKSRRWGAIYGEGYEHFCDRDLQDAQRFDDWPEIVLLDYVGQLAPWSPVGHTERLFARRLHRRGALMLVAGKLGSSREELIMAEDLSYGQRGLPQIRVGGEARAVDVQHIVDTWECVHRRAAAVRNYIQNSGEYFPRSWGSARPHAVLVGPGAERATNSGFPFEGGDSSAYLTQLLNEAQIGERYIHLINAYDFETNEPLQASWIYHLNPRRVVGLGRVAQRLLRKLKVAHEEFPHPQYLRRFEHHKLAKRAAELRRLCGVNLDETVANA